MREVCACALILLYMIHFSHILFPIEISVNY